MNPLHYVSLTLSKSTVKYAVISPGSRSAPLTVALARDENIICKVIPDERSAGFYALGLAQSSGTPVVLICTSGTALLNYYPAIAEAYYTNTPLIVLSADRPPEWIDEGDGQSIRQTDVLKNHVKQSYSAIVASDDSGTQSSIHLTLQNALSKALELPAGPVHVNFPFREPFYPTEKDTNSPTQLELDEITSAPSNILSQEEINHLNQELKAFKHVLIVHGQHLKRLPWRNDKELALSESISNDEGKSIRFHDNYLPNTIVANKQLDLVITTGKAILSKGLKLHLRGIKSLQHWHIGDTEKANNVFECLTKTVYADAPDTLSRLEIPFSPVKLEWERLDQKANEFIKDFFKTQQPYSEFETVKQLLDKLPAGTNLHVSNSMPIRYVNQLGGFQNGTLWCNRGTSGIDGSTSTFRGIADHLSDELHVLLTGDMSFLYDRNAWWNNESIQNIRVLVLNNHGGGIFRMIPGPRRLKELETFFETEQRQTAFHTSQDARLDYFKADTRVDAQKGIHWLLDPSNNSGRLLEVFTNKRLNTELFLNFKKEMTACFN